MPDTASYVEYSLLRELVALSGPLEKGQLLCTLAKGCRRERQSEVMALGEGFIAWLARVECLEINDEYVVLTKHGHAYFRGSVQYYA